MVKSLRCNRRILATSQSLLWAVAVLLMHVVCVATAAGNTMPSPVTMWTHVEIASDVSDSRDSETIWLAGFAAEPGGEPLGLSLLWQKDTSGFFPTWKLRLHSDHPGMMLDATSKKTPDLRTTSAPVPGASYSAAVSVHPATGSVAIVVQNLTHGEHLLNEVVKIPEFTMPLYRGADVVDNVQVAEVVRTAPFYIPLAMTWQLVTQKDEYSVARFVERDEALAVHAHVLGPTPSGTFRFLATNTADSSDPIVLIEAAASDISEVTPIETPLSVGEVEIFMEYVDDGQVWMSDSRTVSVGHVTFRLGKVDFDPQTRLLNGTYYVKSDGAMANTQVAMNVRWSEMLWDAKQGAYRERLLRTTNLDPVTMDIGTDDTRYDFTDRAPVGDESAAIKVVFSPAVEENIHTVVDGAEHIIPPSREGTESLRLMSFNVRFPTDNDGAHAWEHRAHLIPEVIETYAPDVIGFQEPWDFQLRFLDDNVPKYEGVVFNTHGLVHVALYYNTETVRLLEWGKFRLSETPDGSGPTPWGGTPRGVIWGRFRALETNKEFYVYNTHFRSGQQAEDERTFSSEVILNRLEQLADDTPVILLGDFNARPSTKAYQVFTGPPTAHLRDAWETAAINRGPEGTFHQFTGVTGDRRIDWILFKGPVQPLTMEHIETAGGGTYPSDHLPIQATVLLPCK